MSSLPGRGDTAPAIASDAVEVKLDRPIGGIMVAAPMYGGLCHDAFLLGMLDLRQWCDAHRVPLDVCTIRNESLIQRARNTCVAYFLASSASHLVFIDSDIGFNAASVLRLVAHNQPLVGATYARKHRGPPSFAAVALEAAPVPETPTAPAPPGLVEVHSLPTGFLCITRDLVCVMAGAYRETAYRTHPTDGPPGDWRQHLFALFDCEIDPVTRAYYSEDYTFCQRWRRLGGKCFLDPAILLEHHGTARFGGDPRTNFPLPVPPPAEG